MSDSTTTKTDASSAASQDAPKKFTYYPGCSSQGSAAHLDHSLRAIAPKLGIELELRARPRFQLDNVLPCLSVEHRHRWVVRAGIRLHAPVQPRAEIVL